MPARRSLPAVLFAAATVLVLATSACATSRPASTNADGTIEVAASINAWGSILAQLGGAKVHETSIITNPDTDPHDYEPSAADARTIADSRLFVENGIGYDTWAAKSLAASPDDERQVIDVGDLVHVPDGGNPHRWYSPADVDAVADAITARLERIDPADSAYFRARHTRFENTDLATYHRLISQIRTKYAGTPVGASESIFAPLARALRLDLITPPSFLKAISEGTDPSPADKATIDTQLREKKIAVYVFNSQNATPDVTAQVNEATQHGIPVSTVTETLSPANATFEQWQSRQLRTLAAALRRATGR